MGNRRRQSEQHSLPYGAPDSDDERRHHRLRMPRLETVQRAQQDRAQDEKPSMGRTLLEEFGKGRHGRTLGKPASTSILSPGMGYSQIHSPAGMGVFQTRDSRRRIASL